VQFFEKRDALRAMNEFAHFTPENHILIFRDLSFDVADDQILELCRPFGTVRNILTRDINDLMRFLIKEVTFSSPDEAKRAKTALATQRIGENGVRTAILNGGRVDAFDWKMRQRKQWIQFRNESDPAALYAKCRAAGPVVRMLVIDRDIFVLFPDCETASSLLNGENADYPAMVDFVQKLNSSELVMETSGCGDPNPHGNPRKMAIVVDGLEDGVTEDEISNICREFADSYVLRLIPSLKVEGKNRAVLFPRSKSVTNKIYRCLNDASIGGHRLLPVRMQREDVPEPPDVDFPPPEPLPAYRLRKMFIVVDPIPDDWDEQYVKEICEEHPGFTVRIDGSSKIAGRNRALIHPSSARAKRNIFVLMNGEIDGVMLTAERLPSEEIPPSLNSLE
jgi:RNA recognition motif-containing protein